MGFREELPVAALQVGGSASFSFTISAMLAPQRASPAKPRVPEQVLRKSNGFKLWDSNNGKFLVALV